jgi:hypothetical protein
MPAPGIGLGYGGHPNRPANTAQDQSSNGYFPILVSYFAGSKDVGPRWPNNIGAGAGLPDFTFANDAPSYCSAATSSPPVRLRPNKFR